MRYFLANLWCFTPQKMVQRIFELATLNTGYRRFSYVQWGRSHIRPPPPFRNQIRHWIEQKLHSEQPLPLGDYVICEWPLILRLRHLRFCHESKADLMHICNFFLIHDRIWIINRLNSAYDWDYSKHSIVNFSTNYWKKTCTQASINLYKPHLGISEYENRNGIHLKCTDYATNHMTIQTFHTSNYDS